MNVMNNKELREKIAEGYLHIRAIVEVVGKPKEYVKDTLSGHMDNIRKNFTVLKEDIADPEENDELFSGFAETEILLKDLTELMFFATDFLPSSIEIIEPEEITMNNNELSGFFNDVSTKLLALNSGIIQAKNVSTLHVKTAAILLRNFIVVLLARGEKTAKELDELMGVQEEDIEKVLNVLIKEGRVEKSKDKYQLKKK